MFFAYVLFGKSIRREKYKEREICWSRVLWSAPFVRPGLFLCFSFDIPRTEKCCSNVACRISNIVNSSVFLFLQSDLRFPFDTKNLTGFLIAVVIEYIFLLNLNFLMTSFMSIAIGPNLILISITQDLKCSLKTLNRNARVNKNETEITQQFNQIIQLHSNAKQLSQYLNFHFNGSISR